jgi:23S rRNA pseudouridine2605 synthase
MRHGTVSLPRALSKAGAATRGSALRLIAEGRVRVDGRVVRDAALRVDPARARIEVDGAPLGAPPGPAEAVVVALNKPRGALVTRSDPEGRPTVFDLLPRDLGLLRCVGRLDGASAGLLLATTDTSLAAALEDPARGFPRVYRVKIHPRLEEGARARLLGGVVVDGATARPEAVEVESHGPRSTWARFTLREGRNREIRRLCAAAGLEVEHLVRVSYGPVALGALAPGAWRRLDAGEVRDLRAAAQGGPGESPTGPRPTSTSRPRRSR